MIKIKCLVEQMNSNYFYQLVQRMCQAYEIYQRSKSKENEISLKLERINFEIDEIRYYGYLKILNNPQKADQISQAVEFKIEDRLRKSGLESILNNSEAKTLKEKLAVLKDVSGGAKVYG